MRRSQKILLIGFLLMLAALVYSEATKPEPVNWFPSYDKLDKIPLGTFVIHALLAESFNKNFEEMDIPPFEALQDKKLAGSYLFINNEIDLDKTEIDSLFHWASGGNNVFFAANFFGKNLLDTLKLKIETAVSVSSMNTEPLVKLVNPSLARDKTYHIDQDLSVGYFSKIDTTSHTALGVSGIFKDTKVLEDAQINFLRIPMGKGSVFVHSQPEVFSNYFLLSDKNSDYTAGVLAYLNDGKTLYWDNYYKSGKRENLSPLRVLLNNKYFKWAYYFVLIGLLLFIIFEGKRKQRSIPIVEPLTNKSFEYTRTIAGMYLEKKEYHAIARKQIDIFLEYIRTKLRLPTENLNERFYRTVSDRSGNSFEDTLELFKFFEKLNNQKIVEKEDLMTLYRKIHAFKNVKD